jgi:lipopolysaccharide export system permease protein
VIAARYVARRYVLASLVSLTALTALYLVIDFNDRAKFYEGEGWLRAVVELYACKAAMVVLQLAPAAMAMGAAAAVSGLRRTGEVGALQALGRGPMTLVWPIGLVAAVFAAFLSWAEDPVVVPANARAEEITVHTFHRWGDWSAYHAPKRWYRGEGGRLYQLDKLAGAGFEGVSLYDLTPEFRLARRVDAAKLEPAEDGRWRLTDVVTRTFGPDGAMTETREAERLERLPEDAQLFRVKSGRPQQMTRTELPAQMALRRRLGLPSREFEISLHERRAWPLLGVAGALLGVALALRRRRTGHLTAAIGEGLGITIALWTVTALSHTTSLAGHLAPAVAGWLPVAVCAVAAAVGLWRAAR